MALNIKTSFFDDLIQTNRLWTTVSNTENHDIEEILLEAVFYERSSDDKTKKRNFFLSNNYIFMGKDDSEAPETVSKKIVLFTTRLELLENKNEEFPYGFALMKNGERSEILTDNKEVYDAWKNILRYRCIMHTFHDEFDVKKLIGKGHFAKVYYAIKNDDKKAYAIKAFSKEGLSQQKKGKEGFINEIKIMKMLNNDNLIHLYETYETVNSLYLVIELIEGGELVKRISKSSTFSEFDIKILMEKIFVGLAHLHAQNIYHRDLKPDNLLLREEGNIHNLVIADFGLACLATDPDILYKRCGTPGYVAPEILHFHEGDPFYNEKCDIFSAGCIFYLLLTGKKLFKGKEYKEVILLNRECEIDFETKELEKISSAGLDLLKKTLDKDPKTRISAEEALSHRFFDDPKEATSPTRVRHINIDLSSMEMQAGSKNSMVGSLVIKKGVLNGKIEQLDKINVDNKISISTLGDISPLKKPSKLSRFNSETTKVTEDSQLNEDSKTSKPILLQQISGKIDEEEKCEGKNE